ncbi:response regulator [Blastococcus deserti]|uniref:Response regulator n=1 Tax=Blastococcus deserti TaxID=2259033 RepID=A0ABW4XH08_9ACTN
MIRVLLCDDQPLVRAGFAMLLRVEPDIEVVCEVGDGASAVEQTRLQRPDVVVMDVRMPGMDGVEATKQILAEADGPDGSRPKVLILTTYHVSEAVYAALRAGASGFLLKDAAPDELVAAIRAVADDEAWLDPAVAHQLIAEFAARPEPLAASPEELKRLTSREREVLVLIAHGLSNVEIATHLVVGEATVKSHVSRIIFKLGLRDRVQAAVVAYQSGLVRPGQAPPPAAGWRSS